MNRASSCSILHARDFTPHSGGNGGNRRAQQISEILKTANIETNNIHYSLEKTSKAKGIHSYIQNLPESFHAEGLSGFESIYKWESRLRLRRSIQSALNKLAPSKSALLWENTRQGIYVEEALKFCPLIAAPHNLESLVLSRPSKSREGIQDLTYLLKKELLLLSRATEVFCISGEDQWLLSNFGIEASLLPYWPPSTIESTLLNIRLHRSNLFIPSDKRLVLVLGTAANPPTCDGIISLVKGLERTGLPSQCQILIAGFQTDQIGINSNLRQIKVVGPLSNPALEDILRKASACIVHQEYGTGALTRITELLITGIPILANPIAARSAKHLDGVYTYHSFHDLAARLGIIDQLKAPKLPKRNKQLESAFAQKILELCER